MATKPEMMNLFAVPVSKFSLGRSFTESERLFFSEALQDPNKAISNYSSKNKNVLDAIEMADIRTQIQNHLDLYFTTVFGTANEVSLRITQSWLALSRRGDSHHSHTHPNSVISGVLYINLAETDGINFFRNEDNIWYHLIPKEQNYYNAFRAFIQTKMGDILLFPSNISHGVGEVTDDIERVSLAFNTFFTGELGDPEHSNALRIITS